ncbi:MAG: hypothetical protein U0271_26820 [Polyangiaceae bacterium]
MTLVVELGLGRFHGDPFAHPEPVVAMLEVLVGRGYTTLVREIFAEKSWDEVSSLEGARIVEVTPEGTRWLDGEERSSILEDVQLVYEQRGAQDSYSWDQLEDMGAFNIQDLALTLNGAAPRPGLERVALCEGVELRLIGLEESILNWPEESAAAALHELAMQHALIVHSA